MIPPLTPTFPSAACRDGAAGTSSPAVNSPAGDVSRRSGLSNEAVARCGGSSGASPAHRATPTDRHPHRPLGSTAVGRTTITPAEWFDFVAAEQIARADRMNEEEREDA